MRLLWKIRHFFGRAFYAISDRFPEAWSRKISIVLCVMRYDWRMVRFLSRLSVDIGNVQAEEVAQNFKGLDEPSTNLIKRHIGRSYFTPWLDWVTAQTPRHYHLWAGLCTVEEYARGVRQVEEELPALRQRYRLSGAFGEASSLIYHHGLKGISTELESYIKDKVFIDAGAYVGDSSLVFLQYAPSRVFAFEPSKSNQAIFAKLMADNGVREDQVVLVDKGLSDHKGSVTFSEDTSGTSLRRSGSCRAELVTLDEFVRENGAVPVGLIKADVEGMGLDLLKGAIETIKRDRPVLSLCIYHNREELLDTYRLLQSLGLPYHYRVASFCLPWENNELTLLAFPVLS